MMFFCVTWIFTLRQAGIAGEGSVMEGDEIRSSWWTPERMWSITNVIIINPKTRLHSFPFLKRKTHPALTFHQPSLRRTASSSSAYLHRPRNTILFSALHTGPVLATVMGASSAADLLCLYVVRRQLDAAINAVPHDNAPGLLAHWAMGRAPEESGCLQVVLWNLKDGSVIT